MLLCFEMKSALMLGIEITMTPMCYMHILIIVIEAVPNYDKYQ